VAEKKTSGNKVVEKINVVAKKKRVGNKEGKRDKHFAIIHELGISNLLLSVCQHLYYQYVGT
jgi:hypothetical protein